MIQAPAPPGGTFDTIICSRRDVAGFAPSGFVFYIDRGSQYVSIQLPRQATHRRLAEAGAA